MSRVGRDLAIVIAVGLAFLALVAAANAYDQAAEIEAVAADTESLRGKVDQAADYAQPITREESMEQLGRDLAQLQLALCEELGGIVVYTVIEGQDTAQARCEARVVTP